MNKSVGIKHQENCGNVLQKQNFSHPRIECGTFMPSPRSLIGELAVNTCPQSTQFQAPGVQGLSDVES